VSGGESHERALSHLAHELRTPLSVIRGYAELVGARDDEITRKEASKNILTAAHELSDLLDDLLIAFALDAEALYIEPARIELESAIDTAIAEVGPRMGKQTVTHETADGIWVRADAQHLTRILENLLLNTRRHAPDGREVRIELNRDGDYAWVTISDDGPGLTEGQLATVFDRFANTAGAERSGGRTTGLELHNVQRLVELHGGSISATSEPGKGTSFTFCVPLAKDSPEAA
jgi:signal transduction histidine kinase